MNRKFFIDWDGRCSPLLQWIRENHQLINEYVFNSEEYLSFFQNRRFFLEELIRKCNTNRK